MFNKLLTITIVGFLGTMLVTFVAPDDIVQAARRNVGDSTRSILQRVTSRDPGLPEGTNIDWEDGTIRATGHGTLPMAAETYPQAKLMALGAAELDAKRKIAATLNGAMISARRKLSKYVETEYMVEEKVEAFVRGATTESSRTLPGGNVEVVMVLKLKQVDEGNGTPTEEDAEVQTAAAADGEDTAVGAAKLLPSRQQGWKAGGYYRPGPALEHRSSDYTGVIINARNLPVAPALFPSIRSEGGNETTDEGLETFLARDFMLKYVGSVDAAMSTDEAGANPLIVDAVDVAGMARTDLVLADHDAERLTMLAQHEGGSVVPHLVIVTD